MRSPSDPVQSWDEYCQKCDTYYSVYEEGWSDPCYCYPKKPPGNLDEIFAEMNLSAKGKEGEK